MINQTTPSWVPKCKICGNQMVDATSLMMGVRFKCPKNYTRILEIHWDQYKKKDHQIDFISSNALHYELDLLLFCPTNTMD